MIGAAGKSRCLGGATAGLLAVGLLAGCGWLGDAEKPPLPGERISVMLVDQDLEPDPQLSDLQVRLPPPYINPDWPQAGGSTTHAMHHLMVAEQMSRAWTASIGSGTSGRRRLLTQPIVAEGKVFTMDLDFDIRAFELQTGRELWSFEAEPPGRDADAFGGGLAYGGGKLFVGTGFAELLAIDPTAGQELWRSRLPAPMRGAPTIALGVVLAITVDNQTTAFDAQTGERSWNHTGFAETAGLLGGASPAVLSGLAIAPYSSGEVFALRLNNGRPAWSDNLTAVRRADAVSSLADIRALPVIDRDVVFAISHASRMVALDLRTGTRLWDRNIGGLNMPWVAGEYIFLVNNQQQVLAVTRRGGRVKWITQLRQWEDEEDRTDPVTWVGPVLAGDRLIMASSLGDILSVSPYTGEVLGKVDAGSGVRISPIVVDGTLLILTDSGTLQAYR